MCLAYACMVEVGGYPGSRECQKGKRREEGRYPARQWLRRSRLDWRKDGMDERRLISITNVGNLSDHGKGIRPTDEIMRGERDDRILPLLKDPVNGGACTAHGGVGGT
jgi:hypothetical protein